MPFFGDTDGSKAPKHTTPEAAQGTRINPGPFIGTVKNNVDPQRAGRLQVWIADLGGNPDDQSSWRTVSYASPFYGVTPPGYNPDGRDQRPKGQNFETNPHSYGFWMVPPDIGVKVLCMFVNGDPFKGYWFACVPEWPNMHMLPGIAGNDKNPLPLVEYNDDDPNDVASLNSFHDRQTQAHQEQVKILQKQGLINDRDRGLITSSAFRESPSAVFGFSTPGALLKGEEGQQTGTGRKGGHTFVMDDGDVEGNNQLIRIRSSSGHMLMMNDTAGFVYVTNADGTAWFELDSAGNINFYSDGDIQMAAKGNIHFEAGKSFKAKGKDVVDLLSDGMGNLTGKKGINLSSEGTTKIEGKKGLHLKGDNTYLTGEKCVQINGGQHLDLGAGCVNLNGVTPTKAQGAQTAQGPQGMPSKEPWQGHKSGGKGRSSGVSRNSASADLIRSGQVDTGPIGTTGGTGPGPTGFRQGKDIEPGYTTATYSGNATGTAKDVLLAIRQVESGGNYSAQAKTSSASGAYQFIDSTWQASAKAAGIGTQYKRAGDAPPEVQDAVATHAITSLHDKYDGDVRKIANVWFTGNPEGRMSAKAQAANPGVNGDVYYNKIAKTMAVQQSQNAKNGQGTNVPTKNANSGDGSVDSNNASGVPVPPSRSDVLKDTNNPNPEDVGYVPPDQEQAWRNDVKQGDSNPIAESRSQSDLSGSFAQAQLGARDSASLLRDRAATAKENVSKSLANNEEAYARGNISEKQYLDNKRDFERDYQTFDRIEKQATTAVDTRTESYLETNRARALGNTTRDDYAPRTEESQPLQDLGNPAGDGWGYNSSPESATVAESVKIDTGADRNINSYEQPIDASTQDNIYSATDDYGNPLGSTPDTGASTTYNDVPIANVSGATDDYGNPLGNTPDSGASTRYDSTTGPAPNVNSATGSPAGDGEGPMGGAPIGGGTKAPGEGGVGQQGQPVNNAPSSPSKPAC